MAQVREMQDLGLKAVLASERAALEVQYIACEQHRRRRLPVTRE
jgi:hypothetical protein